MTLDRVSVIIPCHNGERFLAEAIDSVLAQTHPAFEIIVVDDGSTDQTRAVVARYPNVRYLFQANQGVSTARNVGLQASQGDYLVFLDHDDRLLPDALAVGLQSLNDHPECGFALGLCQIIGSNGLPMQSKRNGLEQPINTPIYPTLLSGTCLNPPGRYLFRRSVFEAIGAFDPGLVVGEDYDFYLRAAARFPGYCHNQLIILYREHHTSASHVHRASKHLFATLRVFNKQRQHVIQHPEYQATYAAGLQHWKEIYGPYLAYEIAAHLKAKQPVKAAKIAWLLLLTYPVGAVSYARELLAKVTQRNRATSAKQT